MYQEKFMRRAIEVSAGALVTQGTEPFGAVVVRDGKIVGEGLNRSVLNNDPTSHGETEAIREACRNLRTVDLRGCELYTSCEPCALCVAAMEIAGISRLYYATNLEQASAAIGDVPESVRFPIDSKRLQIECAKPVGKRSMPSQQVLSEEATGILVAWAQKVSAAVPDR
jgi:guanine deaminase